jgi:hypothetical protein
VLRRLRNRVRPENGQEVVEFALTAPIFVGLLVGFIYAAVLFYSQVTLTNAARVGTSYLVRNPLATDDQVRAVILQQLGVLDPSRLSITITPPRSARVESIQIDVSLRYTPPLPAIVIPNLSGGEVARLSPLTISADSTMNVE